ncbi:MAG TPA: hypothetical protein P5125_07610, partial [Kiritimatiellia bacterium]|nr:hypothetical protein [Kiritimatiellia bacterium]
MKRVNPKKSSLTFNFLWFQGFMVSWFQGFWFHGFKVSRFHGFIQIGIGVAIAIGIDYLTTNSRDGTARVFIHRFTQITQ